MLFVVCFICLRCFNLLIVLIFIINSFNGINSLSIEQKKKQTVGLFYTMSTGAVYYGCQNDRFGGTGSVCDRKNNRNMMSR
jgi:hypothetical protein